METKSSYWFRLRMEIGAIVSTTCRYFFTTVYTYLTFIYLYVNIFSPAFGTTTTVILQICVCAGPTDLSKSVGPPIRKVELLLHDKNSSNHILLIQIHQQINILNKNTQIFLPCVCVRHTVHQNTYNKSYEEDTV